MTSLLYIATVTIAEFFLVQTFFLGDLNYSSSALSLEYTNTVVDITTPPDFPPSMHMNVLSPFIK